MKIFLSYSSQNRARVEPVNFALAAQGHDVFFDRDDLPAGTEYDERIIEAVESRRPVRLHAEPRLDQGGRATR